MTAGRVPIAGVIGSPVAHSRSPALHGHWLRRLGLRGHYVPLDIPADRLEESLRLLPAIGFVGANVTIPYKEAALALADTVTDRARRIGAVNTLVFEADGRIAADNTDGEGFLRNLVTGSPDWRPEDGPATVFGAGGAARAVVVALLDAGVPEIRLTNRTRARADRLSADFGDRVVAVDWVQAGNLVEDSALLVNTTSLGMTGKPECRVPLDGLHPGVTVTDLVYAPLETRLLRTARAAGCPTVDGLGMLLHQAVPGFAAWFGQTPTVDAETRAAVLE